MGNKEGFRPIGRLRTMDEHILAEPVDHVLKGLARSRTHNILELALADARQKRHGDRSVR
jgi:hypothetical protein